MYVHIYMGSRVSSGSIVSDYGLDDRAIGVRFPAGENDFSSSLCVQTGSGAHSASCTMGTGGPFPGGKARLGRDADHSPPLVPRSWMSRSYTSSPPQAPPWRVAGLLFSYTFIWGLPTSSLSLWTTPLLFFPSHAQFVPKATAKTYMTIRLQDSTDWYTCFVLVRNLVSYIKGRIYAEHEISGSSIWDLQNMNQEC
jgi:hypothetical protein